MAVVSTGRHGDQVTLTSVLHEFEQPASVTFDYLLDESESRPETSGTLSVYLLSKQRVPTRLRLEHLDIVSHGRDWKRGCVYIPSGTYRIMFVATLGLPLYSDIYLDHIILDDSSFCNENITMPPGKLYFNGACKLLHTYIYFILDKKSIAYR